MMLGQIQIFILDHAPQPFDKNVIKDSPAPIHANLHARCFEPCRERDTGELTALITIEDLWAPVGEGLLQRLKTEGRVLGVRHQPR